ncbi:MAG: alpha/beta hydrolase [Alphaproteobacteria bacterium]|nr:alpha/beta hydrolase [Alphaproteobacteria bacterium]
MFTLKLKSASDNLPLRLIWLHGWGHSHKALLPLAEYFQDSAENYLIDLPGFGESPEPDKPLDTEDYADLLQDFISSLPPKDTVLITHSFGGRVAIEAAAKYPHSIKAMVLIASPGLKVKRSLGFKIKAFFMKRLSRLIRRFPQIKSLPVIRSLKLGSADYRNASPIMRQILVKSVNKDLSLKAMQVSCPVLLLYGAEDTATPSYLGKRFQELMPDAKYSELPMHDHYTVLASGAPLVENQIENFLAEIK